MISVAEAIQIVKEQTRPLPIERIALADALGRFLAEDIIADSDLPPFDRSQMDGYAVRAADTQNSPVRLLVVGESAAGRGWQHEMREGEAVRIMTGAPVPSGADSVQQVELTREVDGEVEGERGACSVTSAGKDACAPRDIEGEIDDGRFVEIVEPVQAGRSIVKRGREIELGGTVLLAGERINGAMVAVLAAFGYAQMKVGRKPRVAVLATGTELVSVDSRPGQDQIRDSNNYSIGAYAELAGAIIERLPLAGDDTELLKREVADAAERSDLIITSGGVSMGVYDFTKPALKELNAEIFFERVSLRPGKPTVFARLPGGTLVFGLPGNPVSVSVTFNLFARTALLAMQGAKEPALQEEWAVLARSVKGSIERESYLPAQLRTSEEGHLLAEPLKWGGSSDFVAFTQATALIIVPRGASPLEKGTTARVVRLPA